MGVNCEHALVLAHCQPHQKERLAINFLPDFNDTCLSMWLVNSVGARYGKTRTLRRDCSTIPRI